MTDVIVVCACLVLSLAANVFQALYNRTLMERLSNPPGTKEYLVEQVAVLAKAGKTREAAIVAQASAGIPAQGEYSGDIDNYEQIDETV